jgi:arabinogalactan oligomer/maltooligosaccharide transport system permease protein
MYEQALQPKVEKRRKFEKRLPLGKQLLYQGLALFVTLTVLFPIWWIVSLSFDPRDIMRPTELRLLPPGASLNAYARVLDQPTANEVTFTRLALNQFILAAGVAILSVLVGVFAAYSFSRFEYKGRAALMLSVLTVLILPAVATLAPLYVMLNRVNIDLVGIKFNLRNSLWGVGLALASGSCRSRSGT